MIIVKITLRHYPNPQDRSIIELSPRVSQDKHLMVCRITLIVLFDTFVAQLKSLFGLVLIPILPITRKIFKIRGLTQFAVHKYFLDRQN